MKEKILASCIHLGDSTRKLRDISIANVNLYIARYIDTYTNYGK